MGVGLGCVGFFTFFCLDDFCGEKAATVLLFGGIAELAIKTSRGLERAHRSNLPRWKDNQKESPLCKMLSQRSCRSDFRDPVQEMQTVSEHTSRGSF